MVCQRFAPNASEASFMLLGVLRIASSDTVIIVGSAMIASTIDPAKAVYPTGKLNVSWISGTMTINPKKP